MISKTPKPPYYIVTFTSKRKLGDDGYGEMAKRMGELSAQQAGFLGAESVRDAQGYGITNSYWADEASIKAWKAHSEHLVAQETGKSRWYEAYFVRVGKIDRDYGFDIE